MTFTPAPPSVLIVAGLDPSGGAGLAADLQAITAAGAHPMPVATMITAQSLRRVARVDTLAIDLIAEQIHTATEDITPAAIKLGALGSVEIAQALADLLPRDVPLVLDPVLVATSGDALGGATLPAAMRAHLLPRATLITPNQDELNALTHNGTVAERAGELLALGTQHVLVTGLDDQQGAFVDRLFGSDGRIDEFKSPRLSGEFHGSGCTLAAYCAAYLALGSSVPEAVRQAHAEAARALGTAFDFGYEVKVPNRRG